MNVATDRNAGADTSAEGVADAQGDGEDLDLLTDGEFDPSDEDDADDEDESSDEGDDDAPDDEAAEGQDGLEEITLGDKTARVPAEFREAFMLKQDHTRKTQELAEERKAAERERTQIREQLGQATQRNDKVIDLRADLKLIDREIRRISDLDLPALYQEDPAQAQAEQFRLGDLREKRSRVAAALTQEERASLAELQRFDAERSAETQSILQREIPGWNAEAVSKVASYAAKEFGVSREEMVALDQDPRLAKLLYRAMTAEEALRKQTGVQRKAAGQTTTPAPSLKGGKGGNSTSAKTTDFAAFEKMATAKMKQA